MASTWVKGLAGLAVLGAAGFGAFLFITAPDRQDPSVWANLGDPDLAHGREVFFAGGCASCHAPAGATGDARLVLSGGAPLKSDFGTFHAPNISSHPEAGIGAWTLAEFGDAMTRGVGREGEHLYPSFPYGSYARMTPKDINDLYGFMKTLPASDAVAPAHELGFPFNQRIVLGGWKFLYFTDAPRVELADASEMVKRGQYLVEGPAIAANAIRPATHSAVSRPAAGWPVGPTRKVRAPSQHHPGLEEHGLMGRKRYRHLPRDRLHARLRQRRWLHGRGAEEHGGTAGCGPRSDRRLSEGHPVCTVTAGGSVQHRASLACHLSVVEMTSEGT